MSPDAGSDKPPTRTDGDRPGAARSRGILRLLVALQEREHRALAERLHDGPMQDFTAVLLELASVRRQLSGDLAGRVTAIESHLRGTVSMLHLPPSAFRLGNDARRILEVGLDHRISGLLADRVETEIDIAERTPGLGDIAVTLAAVQLLLHTSDPRGTSAYADILVRSSATGLELRLRVRPGGYEPPADAARASRLRELADVIGADLRHDPGTGAWAASLRLGAAAAE